MNRSQIGYFDFATKTIVDFDYSYVGADIIFGVDESNILTAYHAIAVDNQNEEFKFEKDTSKKVASIVYNDNKIDIEIFENMVNE